MQIGYARVSTDGQDHSLQLDALRTVGCEKIFIETASGLKSDRPELAKLLDHVRPGDIVVIYSLSRLARSIKHLLDVAENLRGRDIGLKSLTEGFDTTTVSGRFIFNLLACVSQMEVELLKERTHAGLRAARARGRVGGRPKSLDPVKLKVVKTLIDEGTMTMAEIADHVQVAPSTIYRSVRGGRSALA